MKHKGFTFIELLIVIIIVSIFASLSFPKLKYSFEIFQLDNFTKNIYYLMRYLQADASGKEIIYCLKIDLENREIQPFLVNNKQLFKQKGRFFRNIIIPEGINVTSDPPGISRIYFYPDGSIDKLSIYFDAKGNKTSLTIEGEAGQIEISLR